KGYLGTQLSILIMVSQKIKITNNEIPNVNLTDNVYETYCQYFMNGRLTPIYDPSKYFCNQSNKFYITLRNINEKLKKNNDDYVDGYIFSAAYKYVKENKRLVSCENGSRRDSTSNESIYEETSNNTIEHSSKNQPPLVNSYEKGFTKDLTSNEEASNNTIKHSSNYKPPIVDQNHSPDQVLTDSSNPANKKNTVVANSLKQSQHQAWNAETTDLKIKIAIYETENTNIRIENANFKSQITTLEKDNTDLKFKIGGLEKDNTELKSKNAGLERDNEKLRSEHTNLKAQIVESKLKIKELTKFEKDEKVIKNLEKEITETNEKKDKVKKISRLLTLFLVEEKEKVATFVK
ncbi:35881_t:CDS:2, partial [Gigaspora margarita]